MCGSSQEEWEEVYDFVVRIWITTKEGRVGRSRRLCSGIGWHGLILGAARCQEGALSAKSFEVETATNHSPAPLLGATLLGVHPNWTGVPWPGDYDFMLLQLDEPQWMQNRAQVKLRGECVSVGRHLQVVGLGYVPGADPNGANGPIPDLPVKSEALEVTECPAEFLGTGGEEFCCPWAQCASSGPDSEMMSCAGDAGAPWLSHWGLYPWASAIVAGVDSFGAVGACGEASRVAGFNCVAKARKWLHDLRPQGFDWTWFGPVPEGGRRGAE